MLDFNDWYLKGKPAELSTALSLSKYWCLGQDYLPLGSSADRRYTPSYNWSALVISLPLMVPDSMAHVRQCARTNFWLIQTLTILSYSARFIHTSITPVDIRKLFHLCDCISDLYTKAAGEKS